jgi:hypothetical protein
MRGTAAFATVGLISLGVMNLVQKGERGAIFVAFSDTM